MIKYITATQAIKKYFDNVSSLNPNIDPSQPGSDFWAKGNALGNLISGISQDVYLAQQNTFVQSASGEGVDQQLSERGQIPRMGAQAAMGTMTVNNTTDNAITLNKGTLLTYDVTNLIYEVISSVVIAANTIQAVAIKSQKIGSNTKALDGSTLKFNTPITGLESPTVVNMTDGADVETDLQCIARLLESIQNPRLGGTVGDYETWALTINNVNGAKAISNLDILGSVSVIILTGNYNYDTILKTPPTTSSYYSRLANASLKVQVEDYIETTRPAGANFFVNGATTQFVLSPMNKLTVSVSLVQGISLSTVLPEQGLTVENLIKREVRRGIISSPTGGTKLGNGYYVLLSDIEQALDFGLSASPTYQGLYASILLDRKVTYSADNIQVDRSKDRNNNYPFIYDVLYENIAVSVV